MKRCRCCHRVLVDPESIARGVGPVCYGRVGRKEKRQTRNVVLSADAEESITIDEWLSSQKGSVYDESIGFYDQEHGLYP